jgi:hypothetical protein
MNSMLDKLDNLQVDNPKQYWNNISFDIESSPQAFPVVVLAIASTISL